MFGLLYGGDMTVEQHNINIVYILYTVYITVYIVHTLDSVYRGAVQSIRHPLYVWVRGRQVKWGGLIAPSLLGRVLKW